MHFYFFKCSFLWRNLSWLGGIQKKGGAAQEFCFGKIMSFVKSPYLDIWLLACRQNVVGFLANLDWGLLIFSQIWLGTFVSDWHPHLATYLTQLPPNKCPGKLQIWLFFLTFENFRYHKIEKETSIALWAITYSIPTTNVAHKIISKLGIAKKGNCYWYWPKLLRNELPTCEQLPLCFVERWGH